MDVYLKLQAIQKQQLKKARRLLKPFDLIIQQERGRFYLFDQGYRIVLQDFDVIFVREQYFQVIIMKKFPPATQLVVNYDPQLDVLVGHEQHVVH